MADTEQSAPPAAAEGEPRPRPRRRNNRRKKASAAGAAAGASAAAAAASAEEPAAARRAARPKKAKAPKPYLGVHPSLLFRAELVRTQPEIASAPAADVEAQYEAWVATQENKAPWALVLKQWTRLKLVQASGDELQFDERFREVPPPPPRRDGSGGGSGGAAAAAPEPEGHQEADI